MTNGETFWASPYAQSSRPEPLLRVAPAELIANLPPPPRDPPVVAPLLEPNRWMARLGTRIGLLGMAIGFTVAMVEIALDKTRPGRPSRPRRRRSTFEVIEEDSGSGTLPGVKG